MKECMEIWLKLFGRVVWFFFHLKGGSVRERENGMEWDVWDTKNNT